MTRDDITRMAREAGLSNDFGRFGYPYLPELERFAALIAAAERNKLAQWMIDHSYATGHGDTVEDLLQELDWQIAENWTRGMVNGVEAEREACAKVCEDFYQGLPPKLTVRGYLEDMAKAIRARGQA